MSDSPLVSVGIPTFNRPQGLESAIKFLITQSYQHIEIIISDNCSPGNAVENILVKYAASDKRIKYFIQSENIDIEPNFNFVYKKSKGKYFMWIADDDTFDDNYITSCVRFLESNPSYALCSGTCKYQINNNIVVTEKKLLLTNENSIYRLFKYFYYVNKNGIFYGVYRNNLGFENPIQKHMGADWGHIARTALAGKVFALDTVEITRSDAGNSASRGKIANRWNLSALERIFLETVASYKIARYLFNEPAISQKYNAVTRFIIQLLVFFMLNIKFLLNSIRIRFNRIYKARP